MKKPRTPDTDDFLFYCWMAVYVMALIWTVQLILGSV